MQKKKEYLILVLIVLGLSLYILFGRPEGTNYTLMSLPEIAEKKFSRIEIKGPDYTVLLQKEAGNWVVGEQGYPVEEQKIKRILDVLDDLQVTALVSESGNYSRYGLQDDKRIRVRAWSGGDLVRDFALGKLAPTRQHTFVTLSGEENVYHAPGSFSQYFQGKTASWRDKTVLAFDLEKVEKLKIYSDKKSLSLVRHKLEPEEHVANSTENELVKKDGGLIWSTAAGREIARDKVQDFLRYLDDFQCQSYLQKKNQGDLNRESLLLQIELQSKSKHVLNVYNKQEDNDFYPADSSDNEYLFKISQKMFKELQEKLKALTDEAGTR